MTEDGYALLDTFGRLFAAQFDFAIDEATDALKRASAPSDSRDAALRQYLEFESDDARAIKFARYAIQTFCHKLFSALNARDDFLLVAEAPNGELIDLKRHSDLFPSEPDAWFERYSKHGSIAVRLLAIAEAIRRDLN